MMLNGLDYFIIGILVISIIVGIFRGFVKETFSLVSWILAFWIALAFAPRLVLILPAFIHPGEVRYAVAFAVLFLLTLVLMALLSTQIVRFIKGSALSSTDRSLGGVFGLLRGVLLVVVLIYVGLMAGANQTEWWRHSLLLPYFMVLAEWVKGYLPIYLQQQLRG